VHFADCLVLQLANSFDFILARPASAERPLVNPPGKMELTLASMMKRCSVSVTIFRLSVGRAGGRLEARNIALMWRCDKRVIHLAG